MDQKNSEETSCVNEIKYENFLGFLRSEELPDLDEEDFVNSSDLALSNSIFHDRVIKNLEFLYDERLEKVLIQYNHVRDTHKIINNAPIDLFDMVIDKSEYLLNSRVSIEVSEIYETLANGDKTKVNSHVVK